MSINGLGIGSFMRRSSSQTQRMEMPKMQTRMSSPFPPPHKTQLPPRYQVSPGPWRPSCRRNTRAILGILLLLSFSFFLFSVLRGTVLSSHYHTREKNGYGVIIDAGSTGSRLHVFQYEGRGLLMALTGKESLSRKTRPGLSSFAANPSLAGDSLRTLLEFAKDNVPEKDREVTRLYLMATAGLRLLELDIQNEILKSCRAVLRSSGFLFKDDWASVITGRLEGIYAWVAANYALGTLGGDPQETAGIVELGGASAQVTFVPFLPPPPEFRHTLTLGGVHYTLYTHSFLQFGQEAAWESLLSLLVSGAVKPSSQGVEEGVILDPCTPRGYVLSTSTLLNTAATLQTTSQTKMPLIQSAGNFTECRNAALNLLQKGRDGCLYPRCAIGTAFIPQLRGTFFATENFYYTSEFFGLPATSSLADVEAAGKHYCGEDWRTLQEKHKGIEDQDLLKYCFSTAYIVALLHDSLGINMDDMRVKFTNQVGDVPLDWALGALIVQMEEYRSGEVPPIWLFGESSYTIFSICGCVSLVVLVVWFVARFRRPHLKIVYDLEKGRYITTAARIHR